MRVAHVLRKYDPREWGGTETAICHLLQGLSGQGVESGVYCPAITGDAGPDPLAATGAAIQRFRAFLPIAGLSEQQRRQLIAVGGNLMSFDLAQRLLRERNLSLLHLHALGRLGGIGRTVARLRRIPYVASIHGGLFDLPEQTFRELEALRANGIEWGRVFGILLGARNVIRDAAAVFTLNSAEAQKCQRQFPKKRVVQMPHGIPVDAYEAGAREAAYTAFPALRGRRVLLVVGRIDPVKNQAWVVEQFAEIRRRHPAAMLVLAGALTDEAYGRQLDNAIACAGGSAHILTTGGLPPRDPRLIGLMQLAEALVVPSLSETFGLVIMEAWSAGAPVIASRTSGAVEIVREDDNGFMFALDHPDQFHFAVDTVLANPKVARAMAARGRELVARNYDVGVVAGRVKAVYEEVIREHRA